MRVCLNAPCAVFLVGLLVSGCATTLSSFQTAKPVAPGHVEVSGGTGLYVPVGAVVHVIGIGVDQAKKAIEAASNQQQYTLTQADQQDLLTAGIALAVMPPANTYEMSLRTGIVENVDVGLRYSVNALRLDAKWRLVHEDLDGPEVPADAARSFDMAVGVGGARYLFSNPVLDALQFVQLGDFSRWDVEVPLYLSWEWGEVFRVYGGPKYLYSRTFLDEQLVNTSEQASNITGLDLSLPLVVHTHFLGATFGLRVGYKYVFLMLELTGGYTFCSPVVLGQKRELGGVTLFPALGLAIRL